MYLRNTINSIFFFPRQETPSHDLRPTMKRQTAMRSST